MAWSSLAIIRPEQVWLLVAPRIPHAFPTSARGAKQRQAVVNREQAEVNRMQTRASAEIDKAPQVVFDSVRRQGLAHEAH